MALRAALRSPGPGLRRPGLPARRPAGHRRARRNRPGGGAGDAPERRLRAHVPGIAARRPLARPRDPLPPLRGRPDPALRLPPDEHAAARLHPLRPRGRARVPRHDLRRPARGPGGAPLRVRRAPPQLHALRARRSRLPLRGGALRDGAAPRRDRREADAPPRLRARVAGARRLPALRPRPRSQGDAAGGEGQLLERPHRGRRPPLRHPVDAGGPRGGRPRLDGRGLPGVRRGTSCPRTRRRGRPASTTTPGTSRSATSTGTASPTSSR